MYIINVKCRIDSKKCLARNGQNTKESIRNVKEEITCYPLAICCGSPNMVMTAILSARVHVNGTLSIIKLTTTTTIIIIIIIIIIMIIIIMIILIIMIIMCLPVYQRK